MNFSIPPSIGRLLRHGQRAGQWLDARARRRQQAFKTLRQRYYHDYWQRVANDLGAELEELGTGFYRIHRRGAFTYVNGYNIQIDDHVLLRIAGNKKLSHRLLQEIGLPVPRHISYHIGEIHRARAFLSELGRPLVIKPAGGGGGAGVTTGIDHPKALWRATLRAAQTSALFLAEEQIDGHNYRLLYLDGELIDIIRRDRPTVVGNGRHSIRQLITLENRQRLTGSPYTALSALTKDLGVHAYLRARGVTTGYVPAMGETVEVKGAVNQNSARDNHRITEGIHPCYRELGRRVQTRLNIKLLGIDIITPSLERAIEESGGAINEINTTPGLHHHDLIAERDRKCAVGQLALEYCLDRPADTTSWMRHQRLL